MRRILYVCIFALFIVNVVAVVVIAVVVFFEMITLNKHRSTRSLVRSSIHLITVDVTTTDVVALVVVFVAIFVETYY